MRKSYVILALTLSSAWLCMSAQTADAQDLCPGFLMCSPSETADTYLGGMEGAGCDTDGILFGPDLWGILLGVDDSGGGGDTGGGGDGDGDGGGGSDDPDTCDPDSEPEPDTRECPIIPSEDLACSNPIIDIILGAGGGGNDDDGGDAGGGDGDTGGGGDTGSGSDTGSGGTGGGGGGQIPPDYGGLGASPSMQSVEVPQEHRDAVKNTLTGLQVGDHFAAPLGGVEHTFRVDQTALVQMGGEDTYQVVFHSLKYLGPVFTMVYDGDRLYLISFLLDWDKEDIDAFIAWWRSIYG